MKEQLKNFLKMSFYDNVSIEDFYNSLESTLSDKYYLLQSPNIKNYYFKESNGIVLTIVTDLNDNSQKDIRIKSIFSNNPALNFGISLYDVLDIDVLIDDLYDQHEIIPSLLGKNGNSYNLLTFSKDNLNNKPLLDKCILQSYINIESNIMQEDTQNDKNENLFNELSKFKVIPDIYKKIGALFESQTNYIYQNYITASHALHILNTIVDYRYTYHYQGLYELSVDLLNDYQSMKETLEMDLLNLTQLKESSDTINQIKKDHAHVMNKIDKLKVDISIYEEEAERCALLSPITDTYNYHMSPDLSPLELLEHLQRNKPLFQENFELFNSLNSDLKEVSSDMSDTIYYLKEYKRPLMESSEKTILPSLITEHYSVYFNNSDLLIKHRGLNKMLKGTEAALILNNQIMNGEDIILGEMPIIESVSYETNISMDLK